MSKRKLDIFELLRASDKKDLGWLARQPADAQKEFAPLVAMRWAATLPDGPEALYMLWMINERVNINLFDLYKHPDLAFRLIASCGLGKSKNHVWLAGASVRKAVSNAAAKLVLEWYPDASDREIDILLEQHDRASFSRLVDDCGIQPTDAKEVMRAFDKLYPDKASKARK